MDNGNFITLATELVTDWYKGEEEIEIKVDEIYVVWLCKTLQNNKALLSTTVPDGRCFEVTYNGNKNEVYLDVYDKSYNQCRRVG